MRLGGRAEAPDWRRRRILSSSARGAQPPAHHGPFQRWLEDALNKPTVRARHLQRKPKPTDATKPDRPAEAQPRRSAATGAGLASWPHRPPARTNGSVKRRVLAFARRIRISPSRRILAASSNGEVEGPATEARQAPRAHTVFERPQRTATHASRPAPAIVRGQPHGVSRRYQASCGSSFGTEPSSGRRGA